MKEKSVPWLWKQLQESEANTFQTQKCESNHGVRLQAEGIGTEIVRNHEGCKARGLSQNHDEKGQA